MAYTDATALKLYLNIPSTTTDDDDLLTAIIARAQAAIEAYTRRVFEATGRGLTTTRVFDAIEDTSSELPDDPRTRDAVRNVLHLDGDLCTITEIVNGDGETISSDAYVTIPRNTTPFYAVKLKRGSGVAWTYTGSPEDAIAITGTWAYSVTPPNDVVQACIRWAGYVYRQRDSQVFDTTADPNTGQLIIPQGIPADVRILLEPYRRLC